VDLFEEGFVLTEDCLQQCATWLVEGIQSRIRHHWNAAAATCDSAIGDAEDEMFEIADKAVDLVLADRRLRPVVSSIKQTMLEANRNVRREELQSLLRTSLTYRIIDIVWPGSLSAEESRLAILGKADARPEITPLLPSVIAACAATLTLAEAAVTADFQYAHEEGGAEIFPGPLLLIVVLLVLEARLSHGEKNPAKPLNYGDLNDLAGYARRASEMVDAGVHINQMSLDEVIHSEMQSPS
jgi:hypothetical protein